MNPCSQVKHDLIAPVNSWSLNCKTYRRSTGSLDGHVRYDGSKFNYAYTPEKFYNPVGHDHGDAKGHFSLPSLDSEKSMTLARALADASSSDAMVLVSLAELNKTVRTYEEVAATIDDFRRFEKRAMKGFKSLKDAKRAGVKLSLGVAQNWLRYRYSFMQAVYDVQSYVRAYQSLGKKPRVRCVATLTGTTYRAPETIDSNGWEFANHKHVHTYLQRWKVTSGCLVAAHTDSLDIADTVGAYRYMSSLYELIPFSFMLDWFVDVGTRIQALETSLSRQVLGTWTSVEWNILHSCLSTTVAKTTVGTLYDYVGSGSASGSATEIVTLRERIANPSVPAMPELNVKFNWKRLADAVSILRVIRSRY